MKSRKLLLFTMLLVVSTVGAGTAYASISGSSAPASQSTAAVFPVGSSQTVEYASFLNVRRGPGVDHAAFNHLAQGDVITVMDYNGGWVLVDTDLGQGWVFSDYLGGGGQAVAVVLSADDVEEQEEVENFTPGGSVPAIVLERIREADYIWELAHMQAPTVMRDAYLSMAANLYSSAAWRLQSDFLTDTPEYRHVMEVLAHYEILRGLRWLYGTLIEE